MSGTLRPGRNAGVMVLASLASAVFGVLQTFWIPRVLSVDSFGYWRSFLLYMGYVGLLHLGLVDGALLLWSKDPRYINPDHGDLRCALRFVGLEHVLLAGLAAFLLLLNRQHEGMWILLPLAVYALLFNLVGLVQVYLQAHFRFTSIALGMSMPSAVFVALLAVLVSTRVTVGRLLGAYVASWAVTFLWQLASAWRLPVAPLQPPMVPRATEVAVPWVHSAWHLGIDCISVGWPIMLANVGLGLMQSADRVTVNITRPIHDFAIYSLSQSTIYIPITIMVALSRVAFSHFARVALDGRAGAYRSSTRLLTLIWMLLLPYYFAVEFVVRRLLPKYIPSLPSGRILLLSVLFLGLIQIIQLNTYSLEGRQRQFFAGSMAAVAVAFVSAWFGSRVCGTLTAVAWSQVLTAFLWWLFNEYALQARTRVRVRDILTVLVSFVLASLGLGGVQHLSNNVVVMTLLYTGLILPMCALLFRSEIRLVVGNLWTRSRRSV